MNSFDVTFAGMKDLYRDSVASGALLLPEDLERKRIRLETRLLEYDSLLVAYSGGVDSAFLAATAHRLLGGRMLAVLADSPSLARRELKEAVEFAQSIGMPLRIVNTQEIEDGNYARNDVNRCYFCKDALFMELEKICRSAGYSTLAYGMNADDTKDYRPGQRAAQRHAVAAPLSEVGLSKPEIRVLSKAAGYVFWDRPAAPCLASRVEYGRTVTRAVLDQVECSENAVRELGFRQVRVRHHGNLARVEIDREELSQALSMDLFKRLTTALRATGFQYVTIDCAGFRSGSMNELLPAEILPVGALAN